LSKSEVVTAGHQARARDLPSVAPSISARRGALRRPGSVLVDLLAVAIVVSLVGRPRGRICHDIL